MVVIVFLISCNTKKSSPPLISVFSSESFLNKNNKQKEFYLDSISYTFKTFKNDSITRNFYFELSNQYYYLNNFKKSITASSTVMQLAKVAKDTLDVAKSLYNIGDCYESTKKDSAYFYYLKAEKLYVYLNNVEKIAKMNFKKALMLFYEGNYTESEIQVSQALQSLKKSTDYKLLFSSYTLLGSNFEKLEEYDSALKYFLLADNLLIENKSSFSEDFFYYQISSKINISYIYEKEKKYDKSIEILKSILTKEFKEKYPSDYGLALNNLGYSKMKNLEVKEVENLLLSALKISETVKNETNIAHNLSDLGEYYQLKNNKTKAIDYLKKALRLSEKIKDNDEVKTTLKLLSQVDVENQVFYKNRYIEVNDSLIKTQRNNRNKYARIEYETATIEEENKSLIDKNFYLIISGVFSIVALTLLLVLRNIKIKRQELEFKKQQQHADEEIFELIKEHQINLIESKEKEQNRISRELHDGIMNKIYGVRLQLGILNNSNEEVIKEKRLFYVDVLQEIEQEVRVISHELNVETLNKDFDFKLLLINLIKEQNEIGATIFKSDFDNSIDWEQIMPLIKINVYRIIQETILNVNKYANAKNCIVSIKIENEKLCFLVDDNGIGFDVKKIESDGIGLKNIKERCKLIEATLTIDSNANNGTKIKVVV